MDGWLLASLLLALLSLQLNAFLFIKLRRSKKEPQPTIEAQQLLADIASGSAILRINVIDPGDIFLKSPRGSL